jgi:hypothetical protein
MARYRLCREYADRTWAAAIVARGGLPQATEKRKVDATVYLCGVPRDYDGLVIGLKPGLDALGTPLSSQWHGPKAGLIVDDSPDWCELSVSQHRVASRAEQKVVWEVTAGWLVDDSPQWMTLRAHQERVKTRIEQRIQIEVEE